MNAIDMEQNINRLVPLVLFIYFYIKEFLTVNTVYCIITNVLLSVTYNSLLHPCTLYTPKQKRFHIFLF